MKTSDRRVIDELQKLEERRNSGVGKAALLSETSKLLTAAETAYIMCNQVSAPVVHKLRDFWRERIEIGVMKAKALGAAPHRSSLRKVGMRLGLK